MSSTRAATLTFSALVRPDLVFPHLDGIDRASILRELSTRLSAASVVRDADDLYRRLEERETLGSTGIGSAVAVPHCKLKGLKEVVLAVGVAEKEIEFESADGRPVRLFFVVLSPHDQPVAHLQSLAAISRWIKVDGHLESIFAARDEGEILATLLTDDDGG